MNQFCRSGSGLIAESQRRKLRGARRDLSKKLWKNKLRNIPQNLYP